MNQNFTLSQRLTTLEERIQKERRIFTTYDPIIRDLLDNPLCKNHATKARIDWYLSSVVLWLYDYDLPTVIEYVAGPFHRKHNVDWKLDVPWAEQLRLTTYIKPEGEATIQVSIYISEGLMELCSFQKVPIREKTKYELLEEIKQVQDRMVYETRVNCTGENNGS
jgi:hypothetical protein